MGSEQDAKPAAWLRLTHYNETGKLTPTIADRRAMARLYMM